MAKTRDCSGAKVGARAKMEVNMEKIRKIVWLTQEAIDSCDKGMKLDNSRFLNEYIENALEYYIAYLNADNSKDIISEIFVNVVESKLSQTETRLAKLMFKLAVEQAKLSNIVASNLDIDEELLENLHIKCLEQVKNTNGKITFEDTFRYLRNK